MEQIFTLLRGVSESRISEFKEKIAICTKNEKFIVLLYSCVHGYEECIPIILQENIDVNLASKTALSLPYLISLLENGVNIEGNDRTALHYAAQHCQHRCIEVLIAMGANVNQTSELGMTPLHYAAENGDQIGVKLLLEVGAIVNSVCQNLMTPLHYAAENGQIEVGRILLEYGAPVNAMSDENKRAIDYAAEHGYVQFLQLLIDFGADINSPMPPSPLESAIKANNPDCVRLLLQSGCQNFRSPYDPTVSHEIRQELIWHQRRNFLLVLYGTGHLELTSNERNVHIELTSDDSLTVLLGIPDLVRMITEYV